MVTITDDTGKQLGVLPDEYLAPIKLIGFPPRPKRTGPPAQTGDAEFMAAWSLVNLRPLWEEENHSKGNK